MKKNFNVVKRFLQADLFYRTDLSADGTKVSEERTVDKVVPVYFNNVDIAFRKIEENYPVSVKVALRNSDFDNLVKILKNRIWSWENSKIVTFEKILGIKNFLIYLKGYSKKVVVDNYIFLKGILGKHGGVIEIICGQKSK